MSPRPDCGRASRTRSWGAHCVRGAASIVSPSEVIPPTDDRQSPCLRWVDPYGDTIFNKFQAAALVNELEALVAASPDLTSSLAGVARLARDCAEGTHLYLWFVGD